MADRRWTVLIVPPGSDSPRTLSVSSRLIQRLPYAAALAILLFVGLGVALGQVATARGVGVSSREATEVGGELIELRARLATLEDTIVAIDKRDEQLRLLAGLPAADSAAEAAGLLATAPAPESGGRRRNSILGRLAVGTRTDIDGLIRRANTLSASFDEISTAMSRNVQRMATTPSIMPTAGWLTSHFTRNRFHPILHIGRPHEGIDVAAPMGAPVVAPASGTVSVITNETGYGLVLEIDHGYGMETKYAHLSRVNVRRGQHVTRGQLIANVGNSGLSTGPHLHYEIHVNGKVVDPLTFVLPDAIPD